MLEQTLDPSGQVQEQIDDLRTQTEVRPVGAVLDQQFLERPGASRPGPRMPAQDLTRLQVVVLAEPILGPDALPCQAGSPERTVDECFDLGRYVFVTMPGRLQPKLSGFALQVLIVDPLPRIGRQIQRTRIGMRRIDRLRRITPARQTTIVGLVDINDPIMDAERE